MGRLRTHNRRHLAMVRMDAWLGMMRRVWGENVFISGLRRTYGETIGLDISPDGIISVHRNYEPRSLDIEVITADGSVVKSTIGGVSFAWASGILADAKAEYETEHGS